MTATRKDYEIVETQMKSRINQEEIELEINQAVLDFVKKKLKTMPKEKEDECKTDKPASS